ncbi:hypothetical protein AK812_SmicGene13828 [Symbiodinium microadriaticum]|uniref:Uncharacterized protein n=1 Tax=Symbiodinium microadriaticum TaxID=2951 RepID=A0A1Q9E764_SYMMI|nr:hypothetical protein AK812_SmicGene13828 [Symbiodinium microadriaticum]
MQYSDRLIPSRASTNLESGFGLLPENASPAQSPGDGQARDENGWSFDRLLRTEMLGQSSPKPLTSSERQSRQQKAQRPVDSDSTLSESGFGLLPENASPAQSPGDGQARDENGWSFDRLLRTEMRVGSDASIFLDDGPQTKTPAVTRNNMAGFASPIAYEYGLRTPSPRRLRWGPDLLERGPARELFPHMEAEPATPPRKRPAASRHSDWGSNMVVILDGRCLCVQKCCCLDIPVPALQQRKQEEPIPVPISLEVIKAFSQRSMQSDTSTRASGRFSRGGSSHYGSDHWCADDETMGLSLFRTRRPEDDSPKKARESLRRTFLEDEGTLHF